MIHINNMEMELLCVYHISSGQINLDFQFITQQLFWEETRMKRKLMSLLLAGAMTATLFAGCGGSDDAPATYSNTDNNVEYTSASDDVADDVSDEAEGQVLKVAAFAGGYGEETLNEVAAAFEASHPGVTVEMTANSQLEDIIGPQIQAGDAPDVVHLATGSEAALTETLTREKLLLPLTDVLDMTVPGEDVTVKDKIIPGFLDTLGTNPYNDGVTYYAPMFYSPCGLFYNAGLFKEKGWDIPTTWD